MQPHDLRRTGAPSYLGCAMRRIPSRMTSLNSLQHLQWQDSDASARVAEASLARAWAEFAAGKFLPPSRQLVHAAIDLRRESDVLRAGLRMA